MPTKQSSEQFWKRELASRLFHCNNDELDCNNDQLDCNNDRPDCHSFKHVLAGLCNSCWEAPPDPNGTIWVGHLGYNHEFCEKCTKSKKRLEACYVMPMPPDHIRKWIKQQAQARQLPRYLCRCCYIMPPQCRLYFDDIAHEICLACRTLINYVKPNKTNRQCDYCEKFAWNTFFLFGDDQWKCGDCFEKAVDKSGSDEDDERLDWLKESRKIELSNSDYLEYNREHGNQRLKLLLEDDEVDTELADEEVDTEHKGKT